ncbi:porin [Comamonas testosteroni]|uniref:porin n=1 Tax=Comamonas testosteroni TaxID=285 RepID=UPI00265DE4E8|nr:porin [Comamonas testosteroni]WKL17725.1 porin [Comamonas testosteroni]WQD43771.1 porin [Comamonas testosteroni]
MTKMTRIALAALAVMGATTAMAQSSVTLYGRVNTSIEHQKLGDTSATGMVNNASRFGIRGTEDLGGGLKAGFTLESGFNSDDGAGTPWTHGTGSGLTFGRQSEVNLSGGFGMVRLGNFVPESYYATADYISMHNHDTGPSSDALYYDPVWFGGLSTKNKVGYRTPNMGGLTVDASVSMHEKDPSVGPRKNGYDLAANYATGPLHLGAGFSKVGDNWQAALRGLYTFGQVTLGAYYQRNKDDNQISGTGAGSRNNFRLSAMYTMGASEFHANVGHANKWSNIADSAATQWTLGYNYNLSKRTKVYTYYTRINNSNGISYLNGGSTISSLRASGGAGKDFSSFAVGIRHNF